MKSLFILTQSDEYDSVMIDTHILEIKKEEIFNISEIQTQLNYLFEYATYTLDVLKRHYDSFTKQTKTVITNTIDVIMNQSGNTLKWIVKSKNQKIILLYCRRNTEPNARSGICSHTGYR